MEITYEQLLIIFIITTISKTYGSIFGGASFLLQPVMLALGIPPSMVVANDVSSSTGVAMSGAHLFYKRGHVSMDIARWSIPGVLIGAPIGATLLANLPTEIIEKSILLLCVLGSLYIIISKSKKSTSTEHKFPKHWKLIAIIYGLAVGVYSGFSGAGAWAFSAIILFNTFGINMHKMLGTRKFIHLPAHFVSFVMYCFLDIINWPLFSTMFAGCLIAGWLGSHIALKIPEEKLRPVFFTIIILTTGYVLIS